MIHDLPPWPNECRDFTRVEWRVLLVTAECLQSVDPTVLEIAFKLYIDHFTTSFRVEDDVLGEWSKVFILLRVMFEEQGPATSQAGPTGEAYDGFLSVKRGALGELPGRPGRIIQWKDGEPTLNACRVGYTGHPYPAEREFRLFLEQRRKRFLGNSIRILEAKPERPHVGSRPS